MPVPSRLEIVEELANPPRELRLVPTQSGKP